MRKSTKTRRSAPTPPIAHLVSPARQVQRAKDGDLSTSLCGAVVTGDPDPAAGLCAACVKAQFTIDDTKAEERATARYEAGKVDGRRAGLDEAHSAVAAISGGSRSCR